jgi:hypothetical protein
MWVKVLLARAKKRRIWYTGRVMEKRPDFADEVLSRDDLRELRRRLSQMSVTGVESFHRAAHYRCRYGAGQVPSARSIQEVVQAWKQIRRWR